jgi:redox-sensing transcriptional repressor
MKSIGIPLPTLKRLPIYYERLKQGVENNEEFVSSIQLGWAASATPEQVRRDLSYLSGSGKSRRGYPTRQMAAIIEDYLGLMNDKDVVLAGVGNLGKALASYPNFSRYGLRIIVLFDNDPKIINTRVGDILVLPVEKLTNLVERMKIRIGIITTPASAAQSVADAMVAGGIKSILNFAPTRLNVPDDVYVRDANLLNELVVVSHYVENLRIQSEAKDDDSHPSD